MSCREPMFNLGEPATCPNAAHQDGYCATHWLRENKRRVKKYFDRVGLS